MQRISKYSDMAKLELRIKDLCKERGMTQKQLAEKLGILPISFNQALARNNFNMEYLGRIADVLKVEVPELFGHGTIKCPKCGTEIPVVVSQINQGE